MSTWLTSEEAVERLGVTRATLYAYVSRGFVRSTPAPGHPRIRQYSREDIERIRSRAEGRRDPQKAVDRALHWGMPLLESSITLVADGRLYYRGHDVCELAVTRSIEEVASLIWLGSFEHRFAPGSRVLLRTGRPNRLPFIALAQSFLPVAASEDPSALDLRPKAVAQTGWCILQLLASNAAGADGVTKTIDETLRLAWTPQTLGAIDLLRAAIILCADHEFNVSSFTARCVASSGANPYMVVQAGLAALEGPKHGGMTRRIGSMLNELRGHKNRRQAIAERLRRGEPIHGFGHPLYETGDPRGILLLALLEKRLPKSPEVRLAQDVARAGEYILGEKPTVDFALAVLAQALRLPADAALTLFALGRTIGWIGHAIEQYNRDEIIRPRAKYVGVMP